jgi:hypothetical protein
VWSRQDRTVRVPLSDRLERVAALYEDACHRAGVATYRLQERPLLTDNDLDRLEAEIGRLLPEEARELFLWHDGSPNVNLVPDLSFNPLWVYRDSHLAVRGDRLGRVTNAHGGEINLAVLFEILNINKMPFMVLTTEGKREGTSPVYVSLFEDLYDVTMVAHSLSDLLLYLIAELESGNTKGTPHGLRWVQDPFQFKTNMKPYGPPEG